MRRTVRGGILIGASIAIVAVVIFAVYARTAVDLKALAKTHDERLLDDAFAGRLDMDAFQKKMVHFHKGTPPCLSYGPNVAPSDEEIAAIERDLRGAGLLGRARQSTSLFYRWGHDDEERRHGARTDEEIVAAWNQTANGYERGVALFARAELVKTIRDGSRASVVRELTRADEQERAISHHELEALQGIWIRHPVAMSFPGIMQTFSKLPKE
jgi:hypothetical protein